MFWRNKQVKHIVQITAKVQREDTSKYFQILALSLRKYRVKCWDVIKSAKCSNCSKFLWFYYNYLKNAKKMFYFGIWVSIFINLFLDILLVSNLEHRKDILFTPRRMQSKSEKCEKLTVFLILYSLWFSFSRICPNILYS